LVPAEIVYVSPEPETVATPRVVHAGSLTEKVPPLGPFVVTVVEVFLAVSWTAHGFTEMPLSDVHLSAIGTPAGCTCDVADGREAAAHPARAPAAARITIGWTKRLMPVIIFCSLVFATY
jgi:hypothetical protein